MVNLQRVVEILVPSLLDILGYKRAFIGGGGRLEARDAARLILRSVIRNGRV